MKLVALDLSLRASGVAIKQDGEPRQVFTLEPDHLRGMPRLDWIMTRVVAHTDGADVTVIEGYAFARPNQAHQIGELGGVVRLALHRLRRPYVDVAPSALKKFATGTGNAGKGLVLVEAVKRLGYDGADNNEADALWLLEMARVHYGVLGAITMPKTNRSAIEVVVWPELNVAVPA